MTYTNEYSLHFNEKLCFSFCRENYSITFVKETVHGHLTVVLGFCISYMNVKLTVNSVQKLLITCFVQYANKGTLDMSLRIGTSFLT